MNDSDVLEWVENAMSEIHMSRPVEAIVARGRSRRRRRLSRLTGAGVAIGLGSALVASAFIGSGSLPSRHAVRPTQPMAFTLVSHPDGTASLTLTKGQIPNPRVLRQELEQAGVPAVVTVGSRCDSQGGDPPGLDQVISPKRLTDGSVILVITPSAMPEGSKLAIGFFPNGHTWNLVAADSDLICTSTPPSPGPPGLNPVVHS
jgi:hypothetical protein